MPKHVREYMRTTPTNAPGSNMARNISRRVHSKGVGPLVRKLQAAILGKKVLANLARGREQINADRREQAGFWKRIISDYLIMDQQDGQPRWGRARRISDKLRGRLKERTVRRYVVTLTSATDSAWYRPPASGNFQPVMEGRP